MVFFARGACDLIGVIEPLQQAGFIVSRAGERILAKSSGATEFAIICNKDDEQVRHDAKLIASQDASHHSMSECSIRFEVTIESFEEAMRHPAELQRLQDVLQDATSGYLVTPWSWTERAAAMQESVEAAAAN